MQSERCNYRQGRRLMGVLFLAPVLVFGTGCSDSGTEPLPPPATSAPVASAATDISVDESTAAFTAHWSAISGATTYLLDLSTEPSFATFVSGYQSRNVGTVTNFVVTGVSRALQYYYRVRAVTAAETTAHSNTVRVLRSFQADVTPIFSACTGCHPPSGGLSVASVSALTTGGLHGPAVVEYNSSASNLVLKLLPSPPFGDRMPRGGTPLSDATVQVIRDWIDEGAKDN